MKINGVLTKSNNALAAEAEGRYPLTEATAQLYSFFKENNFKATRWGCRQILENNCTGEWHHVGKFARQVDYYDVAGVIEDFGELKDDPGFKDLALSSEPKREVKERQINCVITYREYTSRNNFRTYRYHGDAVVRGDWIHFLDTKRKVSGHATYIDYDCHLTVAEFLDFHGLDISQPAFRKRLKEWKIPHKLQGNRIVVPKCAIDAWRERCSALPTGA